MRKIQLTAVVAGAVVTGGAALIMLLSSGIVDAASPSSPAQPAATPTATAAATQAASTTTSTVAHDPFRQGEAVSDESIVAGVIGISESDLQTALAGGQTVAAIAKAHNVDPQKVIDALVTDGLNELAAQGKAGTITQAQADAQKAAVTQRATDQVNGTFSGPGAGGAGCPDR
jgi:hypothetical protein